MVAQSEPTDQQSVPAAKRAKVLGGGPKPESISDQPLDDDEPRRKARISKFAAQESLSRTSILPTFSDFRPPFSNSEKICELPPTPRKLLQKIFQGKRVKVSVVPESTPGGHTPHQPPRDPEPMNISHVNVQPVRVHAGKGEWRSYARPSAYSMPNLGRYSPPPLAHCVCMSGLTTPGYNIYGNQPSYPQLCHTCGFLQKMVMAKDSLKNLRHSVHFAPVVDPFSTMAYCRCPSVVRNHDYDIQLFRECRKCLTVRTIAARSASSTDSIEFGPHPQLDHNFSSIQAPTASVESHLRRTTSLSAKWRLVRVIDPTTQFHGLAESELPSSISEAMPLFDIVDTSNTRGGDEDEVLTITDLVTEPHLPAHNQAPEVTTESNDPIPTLTVDTYTTTTTTGQPVASPLITGPPAVGTFVTPKTVRPPIFGLCPPGTTPFFTATTHTGPRPAFRFATPTNTQFTFGNRIRPPTPEQLQFKYDFAVSVANDARIRADRLA